jgi:hypothetical protein
MGQLTMHSGVGLSVGRKARKPRLSVKQETSSLFHLWHSIQDIKTKAESMKDKELVFMIGLVELLVEERTAQGGPARRAALAAADTTKPH